MNLLAIASLDIRIFIQRDSTIGTTRWRYRYRCRHIYSCRYEDRLHDKMEFEIQMQMQMCIQGIGMNRNGYTCRGYIRPATHTRQMQSPACANTAQTHQLIPAHHRQTNTHQTPACNPMGITMMRTLYSSFTT